MLKISENKISAEEKKAKTSLLIQMQTLNLCKQTLYYEELLGNLPC